MMFKGHKSMKLLQLDSSLAISMNYNENRESEQLQEHKHVAFEQEKTITHQP